jgi:putative DNA primase/helicase
VTPYETALDYIGRGWRPVPVAYGKKGGGPTGWEELDITSSTAKKYFSRRKQNIGIRLGKASGGLVDVDLDSVEAVAAAGHYFPEAAVFGRASNRSSHRLLCSDIEDRIRYDDPLAKGKDSLLFEVRAQPRLQTIFPGSVHETGELIEWERDVPPPFIPKAQLKARLNELAAETLLSRCWPARGGRHDASKAVAGVLARAGAPAVLIADLLTRLNEGASPQKHLRMAKDFVARVGSDARVPGIPSLLKVFDEKVVEAVLGWWGIEPPSPTREEVAEVISDLNHQSPSEAMNAAMDVLQRAQLDDLTTDDFLEQIQKATGRGKTLLKQAYKNLSVAARSKSYKDQGMKAARLVLSEHYGGGEHLIRAADRSFWAYNGKYWARRSEDLLRRDVVATIQNHFPSNFTSIAAQAITLLSGMQAVEGDVLRLAEEPRQIINCQNGELWLGDDGSSELRPHRADSFLTYALDVDYTPGAKAPEFETAVLGIFSKATDPPGMVRHLMEFIGYAIQPRRNIPSWFMLKGGGNNGKTRIMQTVEKLVSRRAIHADSLAKIEGDKFAIGELAGKLIVLDDDIDTGTKLPDGFLKKVSERKLLTGQLKFKDHFEFVATCLPVLLANNFPSSADVSLGLRRRAFIIPFDRIFTKDDVDLGLFARIWKTELPGILNLAIEGLQRLQNRGQFDEPKDCLKAKRDWLAHANPLVAFIREGCDSDTDARFLLRDFYKAFKKWASEAGIRGIPQRNTIKANLEGLGYSIVHRSEGSTVMGLIPRIEPEDEMPFSPS